jgi:large subunit ribosomal protein L2
MPKRIIAQRRGKGSIFRAPQNGVADIVYINLDDTQRNGIFRGEVVDIVNDTTRTATLAEIIFENGTKEYTIAAEGMRVGQRIEYGKNAELAVGNVILLGDCAEGCPVFNIETTPGDGGKLVRSSGGYALVLTKDSKSVYIKLPSNKTLTLLPECRATVGMAAAGGRPEKPVIKAGNKYWAMKARGRHWPIVRGVAMNPSSHPFGGGQHHPGKSKSTSRHAPPGRKVGAIASKRTGRKKKN